MSLKTTAKSTADALGLLPLVDRVRYGLQRVLQRKRNRAFVEAHPTLALPPPYFIYETFQLDYAKYYEGGRGVAEWVIGHIESYLDVENARILDWGCGPGRVVRHLPELLPGATVFGADYNRAYVEWCRQNLPDIDFRQCGLAPPLSFGDACLDLVISISVFTHLSHERHLGWTDELYRILTPGGVAFVTTMSDAYTVQLTDAERGRYAQGELIVRQKAKEGHRVFAAYQPPSWFGQMVTRAGFGVMKHVAGQPRDWGIEQDVWVLKRGG